MILERVELQVQPGKEEGFSAAVTPDALDLLRADGCQLVHFGRGVENPDKFILLVGWETMEKHKAFIGSTDHKAFSAIIGPFLAGAAMEHFDVG